MSRDASQSSSTTRGTGQHEPVQDSVTALLIRTANGLMRQKIAALRLPKVLEVEKYDGNACDYHKFLKSFEIVIERNEPDSGGRLHFFTSYLTDRARSSANICFYADKDDNDAMYRKAREYLQQFHGENETVGIGVVRKIMDGKAIKNNDYAALDEFAIDLFHAKTLLGHIGYGDRFNNTEALNRIIRRFPPKMQELWNEIADEGPISVKRISDFVNAKVQEMQWKHVPKSNTDENQIYIQQIKCILCKTENVHTLQNCKQFQDMTQAERHIYSKKNKLCFSCLRSNHALNKCILAKPCPVEKCNGIHHVLLHRTYDCENYVF